MSTQYEIFNHFNLSKRKDLVRSKTYEATMDLIDAALKDRSWIAFSGKIKSGKSATISRILKDMHRNQEKLDIVDIHQPKAGSITVNNVLNMIIVQLAEKHGFPPTKPRDSAVKGYRVNNILSKAKKDGYEVLIVIDEAHELTNESIKSLKRMRNFRFMDDDDLCTLLLIGQPGLKGKVTRDDEINERCRVYDFDYTAAEKIEIAKHHSYGLIDDELARRVAQEFDRPGSIQAAIYGAMEKAYRIGSTDIKESYFAWPEEPEKRSAPKRSKITVGNAKNVDENLKQSA